MEELEIREQLIADPFTDDHEVMEAAANNPDLARLRVELQGFDNKVRSIIDDTETPPTLAEKLLAIPASETSAEATLASIGKDDKTRNWQNGAENSKPVPVRPRFQFFALAASLAVAVGLTFSLLNNANGPSAAEVAFGQEVLQHISIDTDALAAMSSNNQLQVQAINSVLGHVGTKLVSDDLLRSNAIRFANPCIIIPSNQSAHLVIQGAQGSINVIVINNSPVASKFTISDDRHGGLIVPFGEGNLVLVGEKNQNFNQFSELLANNLQWSI